VFSQNERERARQGAARKEEHERESGLKKLVQIKKWVIVKLEQLDSFGKLKP
jgi:hypothetical protein